MVPLIALIAGTGALGPEIDDGSIVYLLAKPLPRREIVFTKLAVAVGGDRGVSTAVPLFVVGLLADSAPLGLGPGRRRVLGALRTRRCSCC